MSRNRLREHRPVIIPNPIGYVHASELPPPVLPNEWTKAETANLGITGRERCIDEVHREWVKRDPTAPFDKLGGPLSIKKAYIDNYWSDVRTYKRGNLSYTGGFRPAFFSSYVDEQAVPSWASSYFRTDDAYEALGTEGWNRFKPGQPAVDGLVSLFEFHEAADLVGYRAIRTLKHFPKLLLLRVEAILKLGAGAYLAHEFGWKPLLSDLRSLYFTQQLIKTHLDQIKRDNGRPIRRRGPIRTRVSPVQTGSSQDWNQAKPHLTSGFYQSVSSSGAPIRRFTYWAEENVWFSARFYYWIPDIGSDQWNDRATRALFGLNPNPSVVWEAIPWSWLIDWFTNVGDVISNMSENLAEGLVADYAYVMAESKAISDNVAEIRLKDDDDGNVTARCGWRVNVIHKRRLVASPFGFGSTADDYTPRQAAILAALGILLGKWSA